MVVLLGVCVVFDVSVSFLIRGLLNEKNLNKKFSIQDILALFNDTQKLIFLTKNNKFWHLILNANFNRARICSYYSFSLNYIFVLTFGNFVLWRGQ
jgi:hypothetical protein